MAIIYTYPKKTTLVAADTFIISDSEDSNSTKTIDALTLANYVLPVVNYDLQECLNAGSSADTVGAWAGTVNLTSPGLGVPAHNVLLDVTYNSGYAIKTNGNIEIEYDAAVIPALSSGKLTVGNSAIFTSAVAPTAALLGSATVGTTLTVGGLSTLPTVDIGGGDIDNTNIGLTSASLAKFSYVAGSPALVVTGFNTDAALRILQGHLELGNVANNYGTTGQVMISQGVGNTPDWSTVEDIMTLTSTYIYAGDVSNNPAATNFITVDVPNNDITIGTNATQTLVSGGAQYDTFAGTGTGTGAPSENIQFGIGALAQIYGAGTHTASAQNTAIGRDALKGIVGNDTHAIANTAVGWQSMSNLDLSEVLINNNTAVGLGSMRGNAVAPNIGRYNTAIGSLALSQTNNTTAQANTACGDQALYSLQDGENNTAVGRRAGDTITTGASNTIIGGGADVLANNVDTSVAVGADAVVGMNGTAIGSGTLAEDDCIAIGFNSQAPAAPGGARCNIGGLTLVTNLVNNHIYVDNAAAIAGGLAVGDLYLLDTAAAGSPIAPIAGAGGPAILCIVYAP